MRTLRVRWYCLAVCSGVAATQGGYWNNFGPIAQAVKPLFGWGDADIALLNNWGPICQSVRSMDSEELQDFSLIEPINLFPHLGWIAARAQTG